MGLPCMQDPSNTGMLIVRLKSDISRRVYMTGETGQRHAYDWNLPQDMTADGIPHGCCRNKIRLQLGEAINLASLDVPEGDAGARAAEIESAVLASFGGTMNPKYKAKIRSIWVNLKDTKNPDFRQAVLSGEIDGKSSPSICCQGHQSATLSCKNAIPLALKTADQLTSA